MAILLSFAFRPTKLCTKRLQKFRTFFFIFPSDNCYKQILLAECYLNKTQLHCLTYLQNCLIKQVSFTRLDFACSGAQYLTNGKQQGPLLKLMPASFRGCQGRGKAASVIQVHFTIWPRRSSLVDDIFSLNRND